MKKTLLICLVAFVLLSAVGIFLNLNEKKYSIENVLPPNPLAVLKLTDVSKDIDKIANTPFWKSMQNVNYSVLFSQVPLEERKEFNNFLEEMMDPKKIQAIKKFFGTEAIFAIYPSKSDFTQIDPTSPTAAQEIMAEALSNLVIVTKVGEDIKMVEFVTRFAPQSNENFTTTTSKHRDYTIHNFTFQGSPLRIALVRINNFLVVGVGEQSLKRSIDVIADQKASLATDARYKKFTEKSISSSTVLGYGDLENFVSSVEQYLKSAISSFTGSQNADEGAMAQAQLDGFFGSIAGFKAVTFSSNFKDLLSLKLDFYFDSKQMRSDLAKFYAGCNDVTNESLKFIPKNVMAYQWNNCFDLGYYWNQVKAEWAKDPQFRQPNAPTEEAIDAFEKSIGFSVEKDILPAFGGDMGGYLSDLKIMGGFPVPKMLLFVKLGDQDKAKQIVSKLTQQPLFMLQNEEYEGNTITFLNLPLGGALAPAYSFFDHYLVVTVDKNMIKSSIDASKNQSQAIVSDDVFKTVYKDTSKKSSGVQYFRFEKFAGQLKDVVKWLNQWTTSKDEEQKAFTSGREARLNDIQEERKALEVQIKDLKFEMEYTTESIESYRTQALDATVKEEQLASLKEQLSEKETGLNAVEEEVTQLQALVGSYSEKKHVDPQRRSALINEVVIPFLNGIQSIKALGANTTKSKDAFETIIHMQLTQ